MKTNNFQKKIKFYSKLINDLYEINIDENKLDKVLLHILKVNNILLLVIFFYFKLLSILSLIICHKHFFEITPLDLKKIMKYFIFFKFVVYKINNFFGVISALHYFGEEKLKLKTHANTSNNYHFPFLIIGSGPSGAATAAKISKVFPGKVAIIEKGNFFNVAKTKHPGDEFFNKWSDGGVNSTFWNERISFASGSCVGGGSEINSGLYHRPESDFLEKWSKEYATKDLKFKSLFPYINEVEKLVNLDNTTDNKKFDEFFVNGANLLGIKFTRLKRFVSKKSHLKNTMSNSYLKDFIRFKGNLLTSHEASKVYYENNKWRIDVKTKGIRKVISCDTLFICCGSIYTNQLLLKSKIIKKNLNTLRSFKFHPMIKSLAVYPHEVQKLNSDISSYQITEFYPHYILGNAASSIQFQLLPFYHNTTIRKFINQNWKKTRIFHTTFSNGRGHLVKLPFSDNYIPSYKLNREDKIDIQCGFQDMVKVIRSTGADTLLPVSDRLLEPIDFKSISSDQELFYLGKKLEFSSVHIMGGVTSGENMKCIADSYGKVHDNEGLYVNDSSLINVDLLKNPQGTVLAVALRNIDFFLKHYNISK